MEELLKMPYWVIDFLPWQVPENGDGRFFAVEQYYLQKPRQDALRRRFAEILLKVNCYYDLKVCAPEEEDWQSDPAPEELVAWACQDERDVRVLLPGENALFTLDRDDLYMTVYNPSADLLKLLDRLAAAAGVFLWQPAQGKE